MRDWLCAALQRAVQGEYKQWQPIKYRKDFIPRRRTHAAILTDQAIRRGEAELHQAREQLEESKVISPAPNGKRARNLHIHTGEKPKHAPAPSPLLSQHQGFNLLARLSGNASSSRHRLRVKQGGVSGRVCVSATTCWRAHASSLHAPLCVCAGVKTPGERSGTGPTAEVADVPARGQHAGRSAKAQTIRHPVQVAGGAPRTSDRKAFCEAAEGPYQLPSVARLGLGTIGRTVCRTVAALCACVRV